jgi:cytoskeletal protein CcmA (bactofilin family)
MNTLPRIAAVLIATAMLGTAGCGGGGGGGDTPPPGGGNPPPDPDGGITRTGVAVAVGSIEGVGSVIVNGITYNTDNADVSDDGQPHNLSGDDVGKTVVVTGTINDDNTNAVATTVTIDDAVEGPVTSSTQVVLADGNEVIELVVLGQTVHVTAATLFDDTPACPADLTQAVAVEVYGTPDANGVIQATLIECRDNTWDGVMEVHGIVSGHVAGQSFRLNSLTVDYSGVGVLDDDFPNGVISDGDPVEAKGMVYDVGTNTLTATSVDYEGNQFAENEGTHAEIEGFITEFSSPSSFSVNGRPVLVVDGAEFEGGDAGDLDLNVKVEVEGEFDADGVLNATKVEIKTSTAIRVLGVLDADPNGSTLTILGISINTEAARTRFEDKSDANLDPLVVGDLALGDYLEVRGQEIPSGQITAMRVEREDFRDRTELRGFVTAASDPTLTVLGVTITTTSGTVYRDSRGETEVNMPEADFWAAVGPGVLIEARGSETGDRALEATEVALEGD